MGLFAVHISRHACCCCCNIPTPPQRVICLNVEQRHTTHRNQEFCFEHTNAGVAAHHSWHFRSFREIHLSGQMLAKRGRRALFMCMFPPSTCLHVPPPPPTACDLLCPGTRSLSRWLQRPRRRRSSSPTTRPTPSSAQHAPLSLGVRLRPREHHQRHRRWRRRPQQG